MRSAELTAFLSTLHEAILERASAESNSRLTIDKVMQALQEQQPSASPEPAWLPVCDCIEDALDNVTVHASQESQGKAVNTQVETLVAHAQALRVIAPKLNWWQRTADVEPGSAFATGHANTTLIGKGGLEERDDVWVGISLMAPGIEYPEHHHPPEEVYLVLSPGHWQQAGGDWFEPQIGGLVHNTPNILHAMRSGSAPLLAVWCLWKDDD